MEERYGKEKKGNEANRDKISEMEKQLNNSKQELIQKEYIIKEEKQHNQHTIESINNKLNKVNTELNSHLENIQEL